MIVPSHAYATFLGHSAMRIEHGHRGTYQPDQHKLIIASSVCLSRHGMKLPHHPEDMSSADTAQGLTSNAETRAEGNAHTSAPYGQANAEGRVDEHVDGR